MLLFIVIEVELKTTCLCIAQHGCAYFPKWAMLLFGVVAAVAVIHLVMSPKPDTPRGAREGVQLEELHRVGVKEREWCIRGTPGPGLLLVLRAGLLGLLGGPVLKCLIALLRRL